MSPTHRGTVVAVTLTREVAPGQFLTVPLTPHRIPSGVFLTSSDLVRDKLAQEQWHKRLIYRRPARRH